MYAHFKHFIADNNGATAIEYALVAALISLAVIAGATSVGTSLSGTFSGVATSLR